MLSNPWHPMISFVVPAHNEQACLGRTLEAIHISARATGQPYEVIVVDDASTDDTADIARRHNASVVRVNHRQISATRNAGARAANGDRIFFVDADTVINARAVAAALRHMDRGAVGGGAAAKLDDGNVPIYIRLLSTLAVPITKLIGFTGGAFMFCTREAFQATGGFSERLFWGEEGVFALALKREGCFAVLWQPVLTSGRRFRKISGLQLLAGGVRLLISPVKFFTQRAPVEKVWYDSNRADDDKLPSTWNARISNTIALLFLLVLITEPVWHFIPWSQTPVGSPLGNLRFAISFLLCHIGLFFWPLGAVLLVNLLRQKQWTSVIHSVALIAFIWWEATGATRGVVRIWTLVCRSLTQLLAG